MFWASEFTSPAEADLLALRAEIRSLLSLHVTDEAPWVLIAAVHGWQWDPHWVRDWRAILAAWRFVATPPCWLADACQPWATLVPEASSVMAMLGWFTSRDGWSIHRIDDSGCLRTVNIGWDSVSVLRQWLIDASLLGYTAVAGSRIHSTVMT